MMQLTPSAKSSFIAGIGLWLVAWCSLFHLDAIAKLFRINRFVRQDKVVGWFEDNPVVGLVATEVLNFGVHGITNPASTTFALGGTVFNAFMLFLFLPFRKWRRNHRKLKSIAHGGAVCRKPLPL